MPEILDKTEIRRIAGRFDASLLSRFNAVVEGSASCAAHATLSPNPIYALRFRYKVFVSPPANMRNEAGAKDAVKLIESEIRSQSGSDFDVMTVHCPDTEFLRMMKPAYGRECPGMEWRDTFTLEKGVEPERHEAPAGYRIVPVDNAILAGRLLNAGALKEHIESEWATTYDFQKHGFGVCAVRGKELAGWCLSEYRSSTGCEATIDVQKEHRKNGLGTALLCRFAITAREMGIDRIAFDCHRQNAAAWHTAIKAGFTIKSTYPTLLICKDKAMQYGANGNIALRDGDGDLALEWFKKAAATGNAPFWVFINMAQIQALTGDITLVMKAYEGLKDARME